MNNMCVVTDENSKISIEIMNKRGQKIFDELKNVLDKKDKETQRLNNIIEELEKELRLGYTDLFEHELVNGRELIENILNYLKELKEDE